jgi:UDP-N-acetyl-D-mannosaminuronic acid dehydrogenase
MTKLTENSFRDVNIAFANELSVICNELDINVWELIALANRHPRVNILQPGPGVGGHCIAVDPWFIVARNPKQARLIRTAREVNDAKPQWVIEKVLSCVGQYLLSNPEKTAADVTIAFYGIAFKANVDDLRESPALKIVMEVSGLHTGVILAVEPNISILPPKMHRIRKVDVAAAKMQADIHVLLVDHSEFRATSKPDGLVVDVRGVLA